jgi:hypothetical protein
MFEGLNFDIPDAIGGFKDVDDLLLSLNSLVCMFLSIFGVV